MAAQSQSGVAPKEAIQAARVFYEPALEAIGAGAKTVEEATLVGLREVLRDLAEAIANPAAFGTLRLKFDALGGVIITQDSSAGVEIGALPVLLERKRKIEQRIKLLELDEEVTDLQGRVNSEDANPDAKSKLAAALSEKRNEQKEYAEGVRNIFAEKGWEKVQIQAERTRIQQSWLQRESVAGVVGALLLIVFGAALTVAMFTHTAVGEVVGNAFLLILGYFFGQSTGKSDGSRQTDR